MLFCGCASKAPRFAQGQSKGGSCKILQKGPRHTVWYTADYSDIVSPTDQPNKPSQAQARARPSTRGPLSFWKTIVLFDGRQEKNMLEQLNLLSQEMKGGECWMPPAPTCAITRQHAATLQFDSCADKDSLCWTVMMACMVFADMSLQVNYLALPFQRQSLT